MAKTVHELVQSLPESQRYARIDARIDAIGNATVSGPYSPYAAFRRAVEGSGINLRGVLYLRGEPREFYRAADYVELFANVLKPATKAAAWRHIARACGLDIGLSRKAARLSATA